jgi:general secretion pathway protein G
VRIRSIALIFVFVLVGAVFLRALWTGGVISCGRAPFVHRDVRYIVDQLERYKANNGHYPTAKEGLRAISRLPQDPWHHDYIYRIPGTRHPDAYDLFSAGPDRKADTADDYWDDE